MSLNTAICEQVKADFWQSFEKVESELCSLITLDDLVSAVAKGTLKPLQEKLNEYFSGASFEEAKSLWKKYPSICEITEDDVNQGHITKGKLNLCIARDPAGLPINVYIRFFKGKYIRERFDYCLSKKFAKMQECAKNNDLSHLKKESLDQMFVDMRSVVRVIENFDTTLEQCEEAIKNFNEKWRGKFIAIPEMGHFSYKGYTAITVKDSLGFVDSTMPIV